MPADVDILGRRDSLRKPVLGSAVLHGVVFGTLLVWEVATNGNRVMWGDANSGGPGSVAINVVSKIPLPSRSGIVNLPSPRTRTSDRSSNGVGWRRACSR